MIKSLVFCILYLLIGCGQKKNKPKAIKEINFPNTYRFSSGYIGIIPKSDIENEIIYFADPISKKKIKLYNFDGKLLDSISLVPALKYLGAIDGINFISKDTILLNSEYTNKFVVINSRGECWHKPNISSQVIDSSKNVYEAHAPYLSNFISSSKNILYHIDFIYNYDDVKNNIEPKDNKSWAKYFYNKYNQTSYFIKISDYFSQTPKIKFEFHDFYSRISKVPKALSSFADYRCLGSNTIVSSRYSDKLFVLNSNNLKITKEVIVKSNYTNTSLPSMSITDEGLKNLEDVNNKNYDTKGSISQIFYNSTEKKYYLIVLHDVTDEKEKLRQDPIRHFSVIVYDYNFENPKEYAFIDQKYRHYPIIMSSQGLMIAKMPPKSKVYDNLVFTVFKF